MEAGVKPPDAGYLDTLAAALAETGDFEAARRVEDRAIELIRGDPTQASLLMVLEAHRESLRLRRPMREPASPAG